MGQKWFKVTSNCLLISRICFFAVVTNMWKFLATPHAPISTNENLSVKPYFCLGLLANLEDTLIPVHYRSIILDIFDNFSSLYISQYGTPPGALDDCWMKLTFFKFDVFQNPTEAGCPCISEADDPLMSVLYCTCSLECGNLSVLLLFSGAAISSLLGASLGSFTKSILNQVSLGSTYSDAPICELHCTISVQFRGTVPSLMNVTVENSSSSTTWNWV